ncbi:MAG: leucine-rich repeat domain-containing protein [Spirochaetaceae bacterium]|jgi:hypothetical protein|nr:leucine-rich repeat domain-containing protein [Spirochaetaceae bacterium]
MLSSIILGTVATNVLLDMRRRIILLSKIAVCLAILVNSSCVSTPKESLSSPDIPETPAEFFEYEISDDKAEITKYTGNATEVGIPSRLGGKRVDAIGFHAFDNKGITAVSIPKGVTSIGFAAFEDNKLSLLYLPDTVTTIDMYAFCRNKLTNVRFSKKLKSIDDRAFWGNDLTIVNLPDGLTSLGEHAFAVNKLINVNIPTSVKEIGQNAFSGNQLTSVVIPDSVQTLGNNVFDGNNFSAPVVIPESVTFVKHDNTDDYFTGILSGKGTERVVIITEVIGDSDQDGITIPDTIAGFPVVRISERAFQHNYIYDSTSIVIPASIKEIGDGAFSNPKITTVTVKDNATNLALEQYLAKNPLLSDKQKNDMMEKYLTDWEWNVNSVSQAIKSYLKIPEDNVNNKNWHLIIVNNEIKKFEESKAKIDINKLTSDQKQRYNLALDKVEIALNSMIN